MPLKPEVIRWN